MVTALNKHNATNSQPEKCGAKRKRESGTCTNPAGLRTSHPGRGRCYLHGGATPIKHGVYSKVKRQGLRALIEECEKDPTPLNLERELAILRALVSDLLGTSANPDPVMIGKLVDRIGATTDRIQKHQQMKSVSLATLNRVMEQMGVEVAAAVQKAKLDPAQGTALCEIIERRWGSLRLDAYTAPSAMATSASSPA